MNDIVKDKNGLLVRDTVLIEKKNGVAKVGRNNINYNRKWSHSRLEVQPIFKQLHYFQWEQCR